MAAGPTGSNHAVVQAIVRGRSTTNENLSRTEGWLVFGSFFANQGEHGLEVLTGDRLL